MVNIFFYNKNPNLSPLEHGALFIKFPYDGWLLHVVERDKKLQPGKQRQPGSLVLYIHVAAAHMPSFLVSDNLNFPSDKWEDIAPTSQNCRRELNGKG